MSAAERYVAGRYASGLFTYPEIADVFATARVRFDHREAPCPLCSVLKAGPSARRATLAMWNSFEGSIGYYCVRCGAKGRAIDRAVSKAMARDPALRAAANDALRKSRADARLEHARRLQLVQLLWLDAMPAQGTVAETYLRHRGFNGPVPGTVRLLKPSAHHPLPTLVAAAGHATESDDSTLTIDPGEVAGLLRIVLRQDGKGKAEIDNAKKSLGNISGNPAWLRPINDGLALAICEGVEDALSLAGPLGIGAWAIGGAGFFEAAARKIPDYVEAVILGEDANDAGRMGCDKAESVIANRTDWLSGRPPSVRRVRVWEGASA